MAAWIASEFQIACLQIRDLGFQRASDPHIFEAAKAAGAILMTKDRDFAELVLRRGPPPAILLLTCGNTSTAYLQTLLGQRLAYALSLIEEGERLVEIAGDA